MGQLIASLGSAHVAFAFLVRGAALAVALAATESLLSARQFARGGMFAWPGARMRQTYGNFGPAWSELMGRGIDSRGVRRLFITRLVAAASVFALHSNRGVVVVASGTILVTSLMFYCIHPEGHDGADQMSTVTFGGIFFGAIVPGDRGMTLALCFVGAQTCLSYTTAGLAKGVGPKWRRGAALPMILRTRDYGAVWAGALVAKSKWLAVAGCWFVILIESLFPLAVLAPWPVCVTVCMLMAVLHASIALTMGLNVFLFAFLATYPAVLYINQSIVS